MKTPKNVVFISIDSLMNINDVPILRVKAHLPEIVVDGYRIRKNTKNLYIIIDLSNQSEFRILSDYTELYEQIDLIKICDIRKYKIYKILSIPSEIILSVMNGLVIKSLVNYALQMFSDYDGFNLNIPPTESGAISIPREEELTAQRQLITRYSDKILKYVCKLLEENKS